jgi:hypothetical protein
MLLSSRHTRHNENFVLVPLNREASILSSLF